MMIVTIFETVLWFLIYSCIGWLYEVIICSINERKLVNRGFLKGPYCPIYGSVAVMNVFLFSDVENIFALFFAGMVTACLIEYITSWLLEKLFSARWWDYTNYRFNINGRVSLLGGVVFGAMITLLMKFLHPFISGKTALLSDMAIVGIGSSLATIFVIDLIFTVLGMQGFNNMLKDIETKLSEFKEHQTRERSEHMSVDSKWHLHFGGEKYRINFHERHIFRSFSDFQSTKYKDSFEKLRHAVQKLIYKDPEKAMADKKVEEETRENAKVRK